MSEYLTVGNSKVLRKLEILLKIKANFEELSVSHP